MIKEEIWKDVKGYEGLYQVSNLGRVKSLNKKSRHSTGSFRNIKSRILKKGVGNYYYQVSLSKDGEAKTRTIHQLVAEAFLSHKPCGYNLVVNHIDFNKLNNNVDNLEIVTHRENTNQKHLKSSSKYIGVSRLKNTNNYQSCIIFKTKKKIHLGTFSNELEASLIYQKALINLDKFENPKQFRELLNK